MPSHRKTERPHKRRFTDGQAPPSEDSQSPPPSKRSTRQQTGKEVKKQNDPFFSDQPGVTEPSSQVILEAFQRSRRHKKDEFVVKLRSTIEEQRAEIGSLMADADLQLSKEETAFKEAFSNEIGVALEFPYQHRQDETSEKPGRQVRSLRQSNLSLLKLSNHLIDKYERVSKTVQNATPQTELGQKWEADRDKLAELLLAGYRVAKRQINAIILKDSGAQHSKNLSAKVDKENKGETSLFDIKVDHSTSNVGLNKVLGRAEKSMRRIADVLPVEES